jgi:hypothetical protein
MEAFYNALDDCHLSDMGFTGPRFTWSNKLHDETFTQERLNWAIGNSGWCDTHKSARVEMMAARADNFDTTCEHDTQKQVKGLGLPGLGLNRIYLIKTR